MDITDTLVPKSDQLNAEDMLTAPRTVTVEKVTSGTAEQPVEIHLAEFPGRPFKPSKTVRRILVAAWGPEASNYTGRRMTLYRDETVRFGGSAVGGLRVSHLSHIDKPLTISLTETRGKRKPHRIDPLPNDTPPPPTPAGNGITAAMITAAGFENDENGRADWLAFASNVAGRAIQATKELTREEADKVRVELEKGASK